MTNQRIRNLTTGRLHTNIDNIYEDVEFLTGEKGVMTHMLPNAVDAMKPWFLEKLSDARFFNESYDPNHTGETDLQPMTADEQKAFWKRYAELPSIFARNV